MRDIIFRGKRVDNGEWVYGDLIHTPENKTRIIWFEPMYSDGTDFYNDFNYLVNKETVSQFTGLLDANGKKIFTDDVYKDDEGDLFKVVQMDCGRYALELIEDGYVDEFIDWSYVEIIGNIHE